jgi:predicted dienelactone hydrolase
VLKLIGTLQQLTVRPFSLFRVKCAGPFGAVVLLDFSRITANKFMFLREPSRNAKLMEPGLAPLVLLPNPSASYEISLA